MKDLAILLMAGVVLFLVWNSHKTATFMADPTAAIPPVVTQTIIEKFLESRKDLVPIDTVFVNAQPDGSYKARILFFNSKKFLGIQYDMDARVSDDGSVEVFNVGDSSASTGSYGFKPDRYMPWKNIQENFDTQLKAALAFKPTLLNMPEAHTTGMILTNQNLQTRS